MMPCFFPGSRNHRVNMEMNPLDIIKKYYPPETISREIVLRHGRAVAGKALAVAQRIPHLKPDLTFIKEAAMLHDVGILYTNTPGIGCTGKYPYICHGYLGRELLEKKGFPEHARVCERHVGVGITAEEIKKYNLPIPERDMVPVTIEEQIVCYADKFFSKDNECLEKEKTIEEVVHYLGEYGKDKVMTFKKWMRLFGDT